MHLVGLMEVLLFFHALILYSGSMEPGTKNMEDFSYFFFAPPHYFLLIFFGHVSLPLLTVMIIPHAQAVLLWIYKQHDLFDD